MNDRQRQLEALFEPKSIAIIGASRDAHSVSATLMANIIDGGYAGKLFPINPNATEINNHTCYPSILSVPQDIDCAVIIVPAAIVPKVLIECGEKKIPAAIIISSGFSEIGPKGKLLENEIAKIGEQYNIGILGPNCLGIINLNAHCNITFAASKAEPGTVALISQSGAIGAAILDMEHRIRLGISTFVSLGNEAGFTLTDILSYTIEKQKPNVIGCYIEQIKNPQSFQTVGKTSLEKQIPLVALKAGNTIEGSVAAKSHTGALAGSQDGYTALFNQSHAVHVKTSLEFIDTLMLFSHFSIKPVQNIGIITNAGGPGILATDAAIERGLSIPQITDRKNPHDILGDATPAQYETAIDGFIRSDDIHAINCIITPQTTTDCIGIAEIITKKQKDTDKPICVTLWGHTSTDTAYTFLRSHGIPTYETPERAMIALSYVHNYFKQYEILQKNVPEKTNTSTTPMFDIKAIGPKNIYQYEALQLLTSYDIPVAPYVYLGKNDDIVEKTKSIHFPVAIKIFSPTIIHKMKSNAIKLNIEADEIEEAKNTLLLDFQKTNPDDVIEGMIVMQMMSMSEHIECIIGVKKEEPFGPLILIGFGGSNVEVYKDIAVGIAPLTSPDIERMIHALRIFPILKNYDLKAYMDTIRKISHLAIEHPEIAELDINPILVAKGHGGVTVLDARFSVRETV